MKTNINLLHKEFRPKFVWLCSEHFIALTVFTIIVCLLAYTGSLAFKSKQQDVVDNLKKQLEASQAETTKLTQNLEQLLSDPVLKNQIESLKQMSQAKSVLVNQIRELSTVKKRSFSSFMNSLSQSSSENLWLTGFEYRSDVINLTGKLTSPSALPTWISFLSDTEFFKGQEFGQASVENVDGELIFSLTSLVENEKLALADTHMEKNAHQNSGEEQ